MHQAFHMDFQGKKMYASTLLVCLCLAVHSVVFKSLSQFNQNQNQQRSSRPKGPVSLTQVTDANAQTQVINFTPLSRKKLQHESELSHNPSPKQAQNHKNPESRISAFCRTNTYSNTFLSITKFSGCFSFPKHLNYYISGGKKEMGWNADLI